MADIKLGSGVDYEAYNNDRSQGRGEKWPTKPYSPIVSSSDFEREVKRE